MDVIKFLMIRPFVFYVIDFEANVWWYPGSTALSVPADGFTCFMYVADSSRIDNIIYLHSKTSAGQMSRLGEQAFVTRWMQQWQVIEIIEKVRNLRVHNMQTYS